MDWSKGTTLNFNLPHPTWTFFRTFPVEGLAHDGGRALVRAEYGYPKGSPDTKELNKKSAATALNTVPSSVHTQVP
jgi:hypothetical protein